MIRDGKTHLLNNVITTGRKEGMKLLDQSLRDLVAEDVISVEEAARVAEDPTGLLNFARSGARSAPVAVR
jgi:Tfp pilus assembly pilus retraction ATPase PilT